MRITKSPDERRKEIIGVARELFATNGFMKTTISDIANRIGIAKGLFYYYFKTKDDVMNAVIEEYIGETEKKANAIARQSERCYLDRLSELILTIIDLSRNTETVFAELKKSDRYMFHQSILEHVVTRLQGVVAVMIQEGTEKGIIRCRHPEVTATILFYGFGMTELRDVQEIEEIVVQALDIARPAKGAESSG